MLALNLQENHAMKKNELLIEHIDQLHTTSMGVDRIKRNLKLDTDDAVGITRAGWTVPDNLTFVPVDFTKDSLAERLIAAGFDPSVKSFFSWLGVTYYLSAEAIDTMLSALSTLCADGSTLVFDYPDENFFDAPEKRVQNTIMMAKAGGEPMQSAFSYSELEKLLEKHGFLIYELLTPDDIQRDVINKAGADMKAFEHVNYCLAVRKY